jgi:SAM-dependent methyltransferase
VSVALQSPAIDTRGEHHDRPRVSARWEAWRAAVDLDEYASRWDRLAAEGGAVHGEADLVRSFGPGSVVDAGCGTGRVAIELARHGVHVVGVDLDPDMLAIAEARAPELLWVCADLATLDLGRSFDLVVMAGNVLPNCHPDDRAVAVRRLADHLAPGGRLVAGFALEDPPDGIDDVTYDEACLACGLEPEHRWSAWDRAPWTDDGAYAVFVHRRLRDDGKLHEA